MPDWFRLLLVHWKLITVRKYVKGKGHQIFQRVSLQCNCVLRKTRAKLCDKWDFWEQAEEVNGFSVKKVTLKQMSFQDEAKLRDEIEK